MHLEAAVRVPQKLAEVWEFLSVPQNAVRWDKSVAAIETTSPGGVGLGWEGTTVAPSGMRQHFRVSAWDPPHRFAFRLLASSMFRSAELGFRVSESDGAVVIVHTIDLAIRNPLLVPVLLLTQRRALAADLESLRTVLADEYPA